MLITILTLKEACKEGSMWVISCQILKSNKIAFCIPSKVRPPSQAFVFPFSETPQESFSFVTSEKCEQPFWTQEVPRPNLNHQRPTLIPARSLSNTHLFGNQIHALVHKKPFQVILKCFINDHINRLKEVSMLRCRQKWVWYFSPPSWLSRRSY